MAGNRLQLRALSPLALSLLLISSGTFTYGQDPTPEHSETVPSRSPDQTTEQSIVAEPDLTVFTVMAAINAAGYDSGADRADPSSIRVRVRKDLSERSIPSLPALREFYKEHRLADSARDVSQFISLALMLGSPPKFEFTLSTVNLPRDVLELQDMVPLIAAFYEQANVPALWNKYRPAM